MRVWEPAGSCPHNVPVPGSACRAMSACSSKALASLWSLSVGPVSQQDGVFLVVSSIFNGQESSGA